MCLLDPANQSEPDAFTIVGVAARAPEPAAVRRFEPGDAIGGRFTVLQRLGEGGTGIVYRARDELLAEEVAVKVLFEHVEGDPGALRRLRDEVRAARRIAHANVCRVHDLCEQERLIFVVMELCGGETLRQRMRRRQSIAEAVEIARQLGAGLAAAHRAGVVHCDVKPENAILSGGRVVLTDFGIARLVGAASAGAIEGTPAYMSPEQILGETVDERTDVYALATLIFELVYGAHPIGAISSMLFRELADRILAEHPRFPDGEPAELEAPARAALARAIGKGLAKDPGVRFESVEALVAALVAAVGAAGRSPAPVGAPEHDGASVLTPPSTPTPGSVSTGASSSRRITLGAKGTRRVATIVHVLVEEGAAEDEERAAERVAALCDAAEAALVDAGGALVTRVPRAVVAVFGAQASSGDEPERAADAARAIVGSASDVILRAGIDTGRLLIRASEKKHAASVAGDGLTRAASLAAAAAPGEVRASPRTARHLARRFALEPTSEDEGVRVGARRRGLDVALRSLPLLGREEELGRVVDELAGARVGRPRSALVSGPPGIGKSRFRREVVDLLASRGLRAVLVAATPDDALAPYGVVRSLVRQLAGQGERPSVDEARAAAQRLIARTIVRPSEISQDPDEPLLDALAELIVFRPTEEAGAPRPIAAAVRAALVAAAVRPMLLVLDDAHWADDASLELFESIARGEIEAPIALLVQARPELLERRPRLRDSFAARVELQPLGAERTRELAEICLGKQAGPDAARALAEASDGNPFYLEELARDFLERGALIDGAGEKLPTTVEEAIQARLDRLEPDDRDVLRAAAVLGRAFRRGDLAELLGNPDDLDARLGELEARRILFALPPDAAADDRYAIKHALIADVAYRELPVGARRALHAAAVRLFERTGEDRGGERQSELARHLEGAEDRPAAIAAYRRAGQAADAQGAPADAFRCFMRARALAGADADPELLVLLGVSGVESGAYAESERALDEVIARLEGDADPQRRRIAARALHARGGLAKQLGRWEESIALVRRGLALVDAGGIPDTEDTVLAAQLHGSLGWVLGYITGDNAAGLAECLLAVELLAGTPSLELGRAYSSLGAAYMRAGRWRDQLRCNRKNLELGEKIGSIELRARAHLNLGVNLQALGEPRESMMHSQRSCTLYQRMCSPANVGLTRNNLAFAQIDLDLLDDAERELDESLRLSALCGGLYYSFESHLLRARIEARRGDLTRARACAEESIAIAEKDGGKIDGGIARKFLGVILSMAGEHEAAWAELGRATEILKGADLGESARCIWERARALARRGERAQAEPLFVEARAKLTSLGAALDVERLEDLGWI